MTAPLPTRQTRCSPDTPATSAAVVPSRIRAAAGSTAKDATVAPRAPTSSCTVKTNQVSFSGCSPLSISDSSTAQPTRSSTALALKQPLPNCAGSVANVTVSPKDTSSSASSLEETPMSTVRLSILGGDFFSSSEARCVGFRPITPGTKPFLPSTRTLRPKITLRSMPPKVSIFKRPSEVTARTIKPTSSIWAQTMTGLPPGFLPFLYTIRFPMPSILMSSAYGLARS